MIATLTFYGTHLHQSRVGYHIFLPCHSRSSLARKLPYGSYRKKRKVFPFPRFHNEGT
jgi:hypothetical protein